MKRILFAIILLGSPAVLPFEVSDGWGEYKITFTRSTKNDEITVSDIAVYSTETTALCATLNDKGEMMNDHYFYDLRGRQVTNPQHGLYIKIVF